MRAGVIGLVLVLMLGACSNQEQEQKKQEPIVQKTTIAVPESKPILRSVKDDFDYIRDSIKEAIADRGIKINNVSHIGTMLKRTAADVGASKLVFEHAEALEFCSSTISRAMMEADPHNISYCPYIIAIYVIPEQQDTVYINYRKPPLVGDQASQDALKAVGDLLDGIVNDALGG